ncbi:hypothetical protein A11A3_02817 [Alcanivorax hongdengensis A-11-3]|uniref:DUF218 domain-containing protein n=1 Tax=Alcanivorax hongdengensis A-11-3 TaxID=1177179 RepID=L0WFF2_9GAMM|nr:YdcF family protein [Alcanivorax hongdengensis]EKF75766.1 hypothetical protein A11A3_02817 [Alcanivorax hongdengensis A-11-3]
MLLTWLVLLVLVGATLPAVVRGMLPPLPARQPVVRPQAVVVLGAGRRYQRGRYRLSDRGLRRLRHAAELAEREGLPLLVSGGQKGARHPGQPSEASLMATAVRRRWPGVTVIEESASRNTWENARYSVDVLTLRGIDEIWLVSDRSHLSRALLCFRHQGMLAHPSWARRLPRQAWVPSAGALSMVPEIWYEWLALAWYQLRYF